MATIEQGNPAREVLNQPPPLEGYNLFTENRAAGRGGAPRGRRPGVRRARRALGAESGEAGALELGRLANENPPVLRTHDRFGNRIDEVEFHPAWHELLELSVAHGIARAARGASRAPGAHVARAAMMLVRQRARGRPRLPDLDDLRGGAGAAPAARARRRVGAAADLARVRPRASSPPTSKRGALFGMAMTEKQGGSDVRANTTRARPLDGGGAAAEYELTGHKWFCSAPMCDAFLVLAQADGGLSCFLLPRWTPGRRRATAFHIQRLKDKLGNRSNASSEVEFDARLGAAGRRGGPRRPDDHRDGQPHAARLRARLDRADARRPSRRRSTTRAPLGLRQAAGRPAADAERARRPGDRVRGGHAHGDAARARLRRGAATTRSRRSSSGSRTAVSKYWVCKSATWHVGEALECLGGNGYVEESGMPRLYREAPLNSIWEGSGNVICLDVLRAMARTPEARQRVLRRGRVGLAARSARARRVRRRARRPSSPTRTTIEARARRIVERMALALQASLLVRHGDPARGRRVLRHAPRRGPRPGARHAPRGSRLRPHHRAPQPDRPLASGVLGSILSRSGPV